MTVSDIIEELEGITVGHTRVVAGYVVTRWSSIRWEVGTWGMEDNQTNLSETLAEMGYSIDDEDEDEDEDEY